MIQAKSLASVVELADNPPASPHISVADLDPLILYIARVPGSQGLADDVKKEIRSQEANSGRRCVSYNRKTSTKGRDCSRHTELTLLSPCGQPGR